jgi:hypothetical protein
LLDLGDRHFAHAQAEGDVVLDGHVREQRVRLEHHAQATAGGFGVGDVATVQEDAPGGDFDEAGDHLQGGGFAAPGGAEQGHEFAFVHRQVSGDHGVDLTVAFAECLQVAEKPWLRLHLRLLCVPEGALFCMGRYEREVAGVHWDARLESAAAVVRIAPVDADPRTKTRMGSILFH